MPSSPTFVRAWEERARRLWHLSLLIHISLEALERYPELQPDPADAAEELRQTAALLFLGLSHFSAWRPSAADAPTAGPWERGNWANGFLLGAFGVLARTSGVAPGQEQADQALKMGASWLQLPTDGKFTQNHFPSEKHWSRRSTNHGIVIVASALVGLIMLESADRTGGISCSLKELSQVFWSLLSSSFNEGVYPEGYKYAQFSLQEAIVYIMVDFNASRLDWISYRQKKLAGLDAVPTFFALGGDRLSSGPFANWGDSPESPWKQSVLHFLRSLSGADASYLDFLLLPPKGAFLATSQAKAEVVKSEPMLAATCLLPRENAAEEELPSRRLLIASERGLAAIRCRQGSQETTLWILASKIHLTHNKDHDVGSFVLAQDGKTIFGELPGRGADRHSTLAIGAADPAALPFHGGFRDGQPLDRDYGADLSVQNDGNSFHVAGVNLMPNEGRSLVTRFFRSFTLEDNMKAVAVYTEVESQETVPIGLSYVVPGTGGIAAAEDGDPARYVLPTGHHVFFFHLSPFSHFVRPLEGGEAITQVSLSPEPEVHRFLCVIDLSMTCEHAPSLRDSGDALHVHSPTWRLKISR